MSCAFAVSTRMVLRAQLQRGLAMKWAAAMRAWALVSRSLAFLIVLTECMFADHNRDGQLPTCVSRHTRQADLASEIT